MKKIISVFALAALISACSDNQENSTENLSTQEALESGEVVVVAPQIDIDFENKQYSYTLNQIETGCDKGNDAVCAIDLTLKCTLNPKFSECDPKKMPKFVFMEDESLGRPTELTFEILKIKPIDVNTAEIYTKGTCNGNWFGLCNGNIIYVLSNKSENWVVKDIYALQSF
ncbi:MAG: hypothetical protein J6A33_06345 [Alphaproteobacteria bacterium]|nr:hypothetical protein [Alphaproteobacteria bacterium]